MGVAELGRVVAGSGRSSWSAAEHDSAAEVVMPDVATLQAAIRHKITKKNMRLPTTAVPSTHTLEGGGGGGGVGG